MLLIYYAVLLALSVAQYLGYLALPLWAFIVAGFLPLVIILAWVLGLMLIAAWAMKY